MKRQSKSAGAATAQVHMPAQQHHNNKTIVETVVVVDRGKLNVDKESQV
jgi:hypothetical protein